MLAQQIKDHFTKQLEAVKSDFIKDLEAMTDDQRKANAGGSSRSPLDLAYEVAYVNRRWAKRIRGEEVEPFPEGGFIRAPEGYADNAVADFSASMDDVIATWNAVPEEELFRVIQTPGGDTSPLDLAFMTCYHTAYHDGQLNYLQSMHGDEEVHW